MLDRVEREATKEWTLGYLPVAQRRSIGADVPFGTVDFMAGMRASGVAMHINHDANSRLSANDGRAILHSCSVGPKAAQSGDRTSGTSV